MGGSPAIDPSVPAAFRVWQPAQRSEKSCAPRSSTSTPSDPQPAAKAAARTAPRRLEACLHGGGIILRVSAPLNGGRKEHAARESTTARRRLGSPRPPCVAASGARSPLSGEQRPHRTAAKRAAPGTPFRPHLLRPGEKMPAVPDADRHPRIPRCLRAFRHRRLRRHELRPGWSLRPDRERGLLAIARAPADHRVLRPRGAHARGRRALAPVRRPFPRHAPRRTSPRASPPSGRSPRSSPACAGRSVRVFRCSRTASAALPASWSGSCQAATT